MSFDLESALRQEITQLKVEFERLNQEDQVANVSNNTKEWQEMKVKLAATSISGKVILDVGSDKYSTTINTLKREKNSFFTALFSNQWDLERDPKDGSIFIDRNGKLFYHILEYLRTDFVSADVMTNQSLRCSLIAEAQYFHLRKLIDVLSEPERKEEEQKKFRDTTLLSKEHQKKLNEFYGNNKQKWQLIYKGSRDGFSSKTFHNRCDNKGPTMTIIQSKKKYLFGGYTSKSWSCPVDYEPYYDEDGCYAADADAFLFTLTNPHNIPPTMYHINPSHTEYATLHSVDDGPIFGESDLYISANCNSNDSSATCFPDCYQDTTEYGYQTFTGNQYFRVSDIEVFKLT